jgi:hypothetical protein
VAESLLSVDHIREWPSRGTQPASHPMLTSVLPIAITHYLTKTQGVSHRGLVIYISKYLKAKEEKIMETQIFHHEKI